MFEQGSTVYWVIVTSFVMPVFLSFGLLWFFLTYQRKKHQYESDKKDALLREQALIIEKQTALQAERTRIAGEMHDDLGGGLTTIKFLSQRVLKKLKDVDQKSQLSKIVNQSQTLVTNMSEIIWAMNAGFDTLDNLIAYSRRYSIEYLDDHDIKFQIEVQGDSGGISLSGEKRRNIFLVIKEAIHNVVKHSHAKKVRMIYVVRDTINISIIDDGVGLEEDYRINGNGLTNMKKRIEELGGTIEYFNAEPGLGIKIIV